MLGERKVYIHFYTNHYLSTGKVAFPTICPRFSPQRHSCVVLTRPLLVVDKIRHFVLSSLL